MSEVVKIAVECTYIQGERNERKGEEWSSKGMDGCPLTDRIWFVLLLYF
jgi:hypothetical protein